MCARLVVLFALSACTTRIPPDPGLAAPVAPPTVDCFHTTCAGDDSCCFFQPPPDAGPIAVACASTLDAATLAQAYCTNGRSDFACQSTSECPTNTACCVYSATTSCGGYTDQYGTPTFPYCDVYACTRDEDCYVSWGHDHCVPLVVDGLTLPIGSCQ